MQAVAVINCGGSLACLCEGMLAGGEPGLRKSNLPRHCSDHMSAVYPRLGPLGGPVLAVT